jgi:phospholipase/carboxylesterase
MAIDRYRYAEAAGAGYAPGGPVFSAFHGTGADETQFLDLAARLFPEAMVIAPRGDVSEGGALRYFRRKAEGVYDMEDLAARTDAMAGFIAAHVERLEPKTIAGLGYSNGANILASVMLKKPGLFTDAVLMHPLIPWKIGAGDSLDGTRILVTAGGRDPICPPDLTGQLIDGLEGLGATVKVAWHPGGHEVAQSEVEAIHDFMADIRAGLIDIANIAIVREDLGGRSRYVIRSVAGREAEMTFTRFGETVLIIDHTEVPDVFRGAGVGLRLLEKLIADARRDGVKIIPICPFAASQFARHPEWEDVLELKVRSGRG